MLDHSHRRPIAKRRVGLRRFGGPLIPRTWRRRMRIARFSRLFSQALPATSPPDDDVLRWTSRTSVTCAFTSLLLGLTTGMVLASLTGRLREAFSTTAPSGPVDGNTVLAVALLLLAAGVRAPHRLALWISTRAWRRFVTRGEVSSTTGVLLGTSDTDRSLHWMVLSVIALAAGILTGMLPLSMRVGVAFAGWMQDHFLWSTLSLGVLQVLTVQVAAALPLGAMGLALACIHRVSRRDGRWEPQTSGWLLVGAGVGAWAASVFTPASAHPDLLLMAAALPALVAVLVTAVAGLSGTESANQPEPTTTPLPAWSDRWPTLLRASIVAVAGGGAGVIAVWLHEMAGAGVHGGSAPGCAVMAMGVGMLAGCHIRRTALRSVSGFGVACAVAGMVLAAFAMGLNRISGHTGTGGITLACGSLLAIGFATAYGWQVLMNRIGGRANNAGNVLAYALACAAMTIWIGVPLAQHLLGTPATLVTISLSLLALGGTLIIHEPKYSPRTRRARLCTVFASIATMILMAWLTPHWWGRRTSSTSKTPQTLGALLRQPGLDQRDDSRRKIDRSFQSDTRTRARARRR